MVSDKTVWETLLQAVWKPSDESLAIARPLNEFAERVQVSDHGAVSISTASILRDAEFAEACQAAKTAIFNSRQEAPLRSV